LRKELWGVETFVDAEAGLNTAIAKLREALGDSVDAPRFIETLPKRGYRFIGTLEPAVSFEVVGRRPTPDGSLADHTGAAAPDGVGHRPTADRPVADLAAARAGRDPRRPGRSWLLAAAIGAAGLIAVASHFARSSAAPITIAIVRFHNETGDAANDRLAESLTDAVVVSLAGNRRYGVIGNSPLLRTDRIFQDVRRIGGALNAEYVVLGQLQIGDNGLLARAHFIRVSDETHLWADKIELAGVTNPERAVTDTVTAGVATGLTR
jgi:TolB-like protein